MSPDEAFVRPAPDWKPRLLVIDGCNVGRSSCGYTREAVSCAGLLSVVRWLLLRDFECVIFLPVVYNNSQNHNTTHVHLLNRMEEIGLVTFTPARTGSGERRAFHNYDDLYLTTMAERHGGCILSGDKFKDILAQPNYSQFHDVIENRVVDLRFLFLNHDVVHFGDDVFYKAAPELFILDGITVRAQNIAKKIYCSPDDRDVSKVVTRRKAFTTERRKECLSLCDDLIYELCERDAIRPLRLSAMPEFQKRPREEQKEDILPHLEELQLVRDESVWQPGDTFSVSHNTLFNKLPFAHHVQLPEDDLPLIDLSDDPLPSAMRPCTTATTVIDPFDLIEQQLNSSIHTDNQIPDCEAENFHEQKDFNGNSYEEGDVYGYENREDVDYEACVHVVDQEEPVICESNDDMDKERQNVLEQLCLVFPRDVVQSVMEMNASCNADFLAEQCLQLIH